MRKVRVGILLASLLLIPNAVLAQNSDKQEAARNKAEAAYLARLKVEGRVLKVEQHKKVYRVKVLKESGRVVMVEIKRVKKAEMKKEGK